MSSLVSEEPVPPPSPVLEDEDLQDVLMQMLVQEQDATAEENIVSLADQDPANKENVTTIHDKQFDTNFLNMDESEVLNFVDQQTCQVA